MTSNEIKNNLAVETHGEKDEEIAHEPHKQVRTPSPYP
jgi:hypothetical protein